MRTGLRPVRAPARLLRRVDSVTLPPGRAARPRMRAAAVQWPQVHTRACTRPCSHAAANVWGLGCAPVCSPSPRSACSGSSWTPYGPMRARPDRAGLEARLKARAAKRSLADLSVGPVLTWTNERMKAHMDRLLQIPGARLRADRRLLRLLRLLRLFRWLPQHVDRLLQDPGVRLGWTGAYQALLEEQRRGQGRAWGLSVRWLAAGGDSCARPLGSASPPPQTGCARGRAPLGGSCCAATAC